MPKPTPKAVSLSTVALRLYLSPRAELQVSRCATICFPTAVCQDRPGCLSPPQLVATHDRRNTWRRLMNRMSLPLLLPSLKVSSLAGRISPLVVGHLESSTFTRVRRRAGFLPAYRWYLGWSATGGTMHQPFYLHNGLAIFMVPLSLGALVKPAHGSTRWICH